MSQGIINDYVDAMVAKLEAIESIAEVNNYAKVSFDSNPAVNITMAGNDNEFWSVAENKIGYNYIVRTMIPLGGNPVDPTYDNTKQKAEVTMRKVMSDIITAFDADITLGGLANKVKAATSGLSAQELASGWVLVGDVKIQIEKITRVR